MAKQTRNPRVPHVARFIGRIEFSDECWEWAGYREPQGYGRFGADNKWHWAHRYAYALWVGPLVEGLTIDHLCRNRACVRPEHLEQVTNTVNVLRGVGLTAANARRDACAAGHEYAPGTFKFKTQNKQERVCLICVKERNRRYYQTVTRPARASNCGAQEVV